jgi:hypothetical protein
MMRRWLDKEVVQSRRLDDMESLDAWKISVWNQGQATVESTADRCRDGRHSMRFRTSTTGTRPSPDGGVFGATSAVRSFDGENWRDFNRLSFWVYPQVPGFHAVALSVRLQNRSKQLGRDTHHFLLKNEQWNHIVWEFPDVDRDQVTELAFVHVINGREPGAADTAVFDIDQVELQKVVADHYEGWSVADGKIAFSHTGYPTVGPKLAIASQLESDGFQLLDESTGEVAFQGEVQIQTTPIGRFHVMDFSSFQQTGDYALRAGNQRTRPFRIDDHVWDRTIWKALNFFYAERCGVAVPGVHDKCHQDWRGHWKGEHINISGGWHDAGDLSQGLVNTSEAVYAMFDLAEAFQSQSHESRQELADRLIEEAKWGLDWVMKTTFSDGARVHWATMRFWTNGRLGDYDDVVAEARCEPSSNFYAAAAEAIAYRVLRAREPDLAERALKQARADWQFGRDMLAVQPKTSITVELGSIAILASLELSEATGEQPFADLARDLASVIVDSQHREFLPGVDVRLTGFFYRTPARRSPMTFMHRGHEQAPIVAMARLCQALPDDPQWIEWYAVVALHSEFYQQAMAEWTAPYYLLPNSIRHADPAREPAGGRDRDIWQQITAGFPVGNNTFIRVYPVHPNATFRGNYGTVLSQAKAVAAAARLRRQPGLADLCQRQLYWIVGLNPFVQSTMYGEGYDFAPQYTARSGDIVGSLPVGMKSRGNRDLPYWPATNIWNYKEVWVHPVSRWLWLLADLDQHQPPKTSSPLTLNLDAKSTAAGKVNLTLKIEGKGQHSLSLRTFNLDVEARTKQVELLPGQPKTVRWQVTIEDAKRPWIAVLVPDGDLSQRVEMLSHVSTADGQP